MYKFSRNPSLLLLISSLIIPAFSAANDTILSSQSITDGETLVSSGGFFELGFFSLGNSTNRYVGIWYNNIPVRTYVWVANRQSPLTTTSGVLTLTGSGILALFNHTNGTIIWSSNTTTPSVGKSSAQLLDSGNLAVKNADDRSPDNYLWQSFDYPSDTLLPLMSLGWNLVTGVETYLSSWTSDDDPSPSDFTLHLDRNGYPQILMKRGESIQYRMGPWNGLRFSGAPTGNIIYQSLRMNENEVKFESYVGDQSTVTRVKVRPDNVVLRVTWNDRTNSWSTYRNMPLDSCDSYNSCGAYGVCSIGNSPPCGCLGKFVPKGQESWIGANSSDGCSRRLPLDCRGDVFLKYSGIKLPDARNATFDDRIISLVDCEAECRKECSCMAYTQLNISGSGSGCLFYHGDLIDIRTVSSAGQDLYVRMAYAERENVAHAKGRERVILIVSLTSVVGAVLLCLSLVLVCTQKRKRDNGPFSGSHGEETELPFFNLSTILKSTDHFSNKNKLGEGGFGSVYKGMLEDGREIAVKRLSKTSSQGVDELKNELILIAKLQHRNLVKLLGCCIQGKENMLIYEYMPNNSLDLILFDQTRSKLLDWKKRSHIINGIAKGLLYLHQDSRLRIIHRDLKTSNVLLDVNMNPKISDFGLARSFGGNETAAKTRRVIGTYGYMSPEYAMDGLFSIKSDVFSFGVLVLEVASGKRNRGFSVQDYNLNLIGHAWTLYKEDNLHKLVDASLGDSFDSSQVLRSIHIGLLCVQKYPQDRPNMSSIVFMLENEVELPHVKQPGFFIEENVAGSTIAVNSENQVTITLPEGR